MTDLPHLRTERTRTSRAPNGQYVQQVWASDVHYLTGGKFEVCDPAIRAASRGWKLDTMPYRALFPAYADGVLGFRDVRKHKDVEYLIANVGVLPVDGIVGLGEVVYPDAYGKGCNLVYRLRASGIAKLVQVMPDSEITGPFQFGIELPERARVKRRNAAKNEYEVLRTGKKRTDTARMTVIELDGQESFINPFTWSCGLAGGVLPLDIEYVKGRWVFTKSIPKAWDRSAPLEMDLTATGTVVSDGYIGHTGGATYLADTQAATANSIGLADTANVLWGKKGTATRFSYCYVVAWSNTVPATAINVSVDHKVTVTSLTAGLAKWCQWMPSNPASPTTSDWALTTKRGIVDWGASEINSGSAGDKIVALNATALAALVLGGTNSYCVREAANDFAQVNFTGGTLTPLIGYSENATPGNRPVQTITYTLPASGTLPRSALGGLATNKQLGSFAS